MRFLPVGLAYVVTAVENAGFEFDILDIDGANHNDEYVSDYLSSHLYDVVLVGSIVTHYKWIKWFIHESKKYIPGATVIIGNSVGGTIPEVIFSHTPADIIVVGEADVTTVKVLEALKAGKNLGKINAPEEPIVHNNGDLPPAYRGKGIDGIIFRDPNGRIVHNGLRKAARKIDDFSFPNWELFNVSAYNDYSGNVAHATTYYAEEEAVVMPVNTARGCVFKCTFCHYVFWNDPYRFRSPASIISEIRQNKEKYGANYINFWDELSFHKLNMAEDFADAMIEADLKVHWTAAVRSDLFGRDDIPIEDRRRVAEKFKAAGCLAVGYSLESGNDGILKTMNKRVKSVYFQNQVKLLKQVGIITSTSLVIGYPEETRETIAETMEMCLQAEIYPSVGFLLPLPSTGMWTHAMEHGFIKDADAFLTAVTERQDVVMNMTAMKDEELSEEVKNWLEHLSIELGLELGDDLVRTGGYERHGRNQNKNSVGDTLNYASMSGTV
jgi:radical SAM superfamily enzyme YgiQ (UPF0313 family)